MTQSDSPARNWLFGLALLITTLIAYQPSWTGAPIWDDEIHLITPQMRSLSGLERIWLQPKTTQQYHPLVDTVFWFEDKAWGSSTIGYHIVSILLHVASALLLWAIVRHLGIPGAWLAAALFALHPVQVESVAWLVELKNTLSGVFYFGALWLYLKFIQTRNLRFYVSALSLFAIGLFAKTIVATLPIAILILLWWKRGKIKWKQDLFPLFPFIVLAILAGAVTGWMEQRFSGAEGHAFALPLIDRALVAGHAFWFHLAKFLWPADLLLIYPRWKIDSTDWRQYFFLIVALALFALLWSFRKRTPSVWAAFLFYLLMLFPTLGFFNVYYFRFSFVADHFQYLPIVGLSVLASAAATTATVQLRGWARRACQTLLLLFVLTLAILSGMHSRVFHDPITCYQNVIAKNPDCAIAHNNLGSVLMRSGEIDSALAHYDNAIAIQPNEEVGYFNRGAALLEKGKVAEAIQDLRTALSINPNYVKAYYNLANAYAHQGRTDLAVIQYERALMLAPDFIDAHANLGNAFLQKGELDSAISHYEKAVALDTASAAAHYNLAVALHRFGRLDEAIAQYRKTLALQSDYPDAEQNLSNALKQKLNNKP